MAVSPTAGAAPTLRAARERVVRVRARRGDVDRGRRSVVLAHELVHRGL